jgi:hypothetical protein
MAAALAKEDATENWAAWWTLQQLKPNAHAGKQKGETTKRVDVEAYRWLVIDVGHRRKLPNAAGHGWRLSDERIRTVRRSESQVAGGTAG